MIPTFVWGIITTQPYYDTQLPIQEFSLYYLSMNLKSILAAKLWKTIHFLTLTNACPTETTLHINSNKYQRDCYYFSISIIVQARSVGTSVRFYVSQFYGNGTHSYYKLQLFVWVVLGKNFMLFLKIINTCQISPSAIGSLTQDCITSIT